MNTATRPRLSFAGGCVAAASGRDAAARFGELRAPNRGLDSSAPRPFLTIGHSSRAIDEFIALLTDAAVQHVVDVRTVPRSRANPQYNADALAEALREFRIGYEHMAMLGGLRGRMPAAPAQVNAFWRNRSFHNYADYAMGEDFRSGLTRLRETGHALQCAIMCAEAVWWRCHRRIIADHLIAAGETVFHILGRHRIEQARMTAAATFEPDGRLTYPAG